ncbi:MAG: hypothetical protein AAF939_02530, partial [Planctomycetota bacterium]
TQIPDRIPQEHDPHRGEIKQNLTPCSGHLGTTKSNRSDVWLAIFELFDQVGTVQVTTRFPNGKKDSHGYPAPRQFPDGNYVRLAKLLIGESRSEAKATVGPEAASYRHFGNSYSYSVAEIACPIPPGTKMRHSTRLSRQQRYYQTKPTH